ncbi:MAG TPA: hypothetical protein VNO31_45610, partial [Umezawaea sp.]|nr:hypothetical protein [Umezawaea sp.]
MPAPDQEQGGRHGDHQGPAQHREHEGEGGAATGGPALLDGQPPVPRGLPVTGHGGQHGVEVRHRGVGVVVEVPVQPGPVVAVLGTGGGGDPLGAQQVQERGGGGRDGVGGDDAHDEAPLVHEWSADHPARRSAEVVELANAFGAVRGDLAALADGHQVPVDRRR